MNRTNKILAVVLAIQVALLGIRVVWPESSDNKAAPGGALVADLDPAAVTQVQITDDTGKQVTLEKVDDEWVLPDYDNFPVEGARVLTLLTQIDAIRADRLITESETSFRRLQVSPDDFVRQVVFEQAGGAAHTLYLGKTGGGNTVHVRLDDQKQVYLVGDLSSAEANAQPSGWINTTYFSATAEDIQRFRLQNANGDFEFTKTGDVWTIAGLEAGEEVNQDALTQLLSAVAALRISAPIGKEAQESFGLAEPPATITLTVLETAEAEATATPESPALLAIPTEEGQATSTPTAAPEKVAKEYTFQIGAALDDGVVIKGSNSDYYVLITTTTADRFTGKTRADFVTVPPTPTPEPTQTAEPTSETEVPMSVPPTPTAETPEADVTPEATPTPAP